MKDEGGRTKIEGIQAKVQSSLPASASLHPSFPLPSALGLHPSSFPSAFRLYPSAFILKP